MLITFLLFDLFITFIIRFRFNANAEIQKRDIQTLTEPWIFTLIWPLIWKKRPPTSLVNWWKTFS